MEQYCPVTLEQHAWTMGMWAEYMDTVYKQREGEPRLSVLLCTYGARFHVVVLSPQKKY